MSSVSRFCVWIVLPDLLVDVAQCVHARGAPAVTQEGDGRCVARAG